MVSHSVSNSVAAWVAEKVFELGERKADVMVVWLADVLDELKDV